MQFAVRLKCAVLAASSVFGLAVGVNANAALFDRGNGLIFDTVLNVTWLQDANLAASNTFGIADIGLSAPGNMRWATANLWISAMNTVGYKGYSDWRLPEVAPIGATFDYRFGRTGATDVGYLITSPSAELSFMHYANLENKGFYTGVHNDVLNSGPFINLQNGGYWYGLDYAPDPESAWHFHTGNGVQGFAQKFLRMNAWAVRSGDVAPVPEASEYAMLLAGLVLVAGVSRKRRGALNGSCR